MYIPMFNKSVSLPTLTHYTHANLSYVGKQSMLGTVTTDRLLVRSEQLEIISSHDAEDLVTAVRFNRP